MTTAATNSVPKVSVRLGAGTWMLVAGACAAARAWGSSSTFVITGRAPAPSMHGMVGAVGRATASVSASDAGVSLSLTPSAMLACLALWARRRALWAKRQARPQVARAARGGEATAGPHSVALLTLEAAALRAEVARLQKERSTFQRPNEGSLFEAFDTDHSGGVDAAELQRGLGELTGNEMSTETAKRLLDKYDENGDGVLQPDEIDVERMEATLKQWSMEWEATLASWRHARVERAAVQAPACWPDRKSRWASYVGM